MKVSNALLALGLMAAISSVAHLSFAQTAALKPATPIAASAPTAVPALIPYSGAVVAPDGKTFAEEAGVPSRYTKTKLAEKLFGRKPKPSRSTPLDTTRSAAWRGQPERPAH